MICISRIDIMSIQLHQPRIWQSFLTLLSPTIIWNLSSKLVKFQSINSAAQSCPTLCDPMDCSTPGFPVLYLSKISQSLLKLMSIELVMPSNHFVLCHPLLLPLQAFPASGFFPMSRLFASGGQSIGASASASVLPMTIQSWFPLGLTGLISLLSNLFSRIFIA